MISAPLVPAPDLLAAAPGYRGGGVAFGGAAHRRAAEARPQRLWIAFGGGADQGWMRLLRPGFRHCFAALRDEGGWTVLDPLSGRLLVTRLPVEPGFDLPGFWGRAGCRVLGPFVPAAPAQAWPAVIPFSCVALCRALLGPGAPFAVTPYGLYRRLEKNSSHEENVLDESGSGG
ncbi:hypothetical protein SAMN02745194_03503 [Roseomonas rosea]|uniref:Uncharacterized protein n=2 Tax=Muricoccus roseus TaxID=198092 RepID=A0A1M6MKL2_9PROT|nr:hypothetical protein SAMN02745194_03503 [Roseomonas rosea]